MTEIKITLRVRPPITANQRKQILQYIKSTLGDSTKVLDGRVISEPSIDIDADIFIEGRMSKDSKTILNDLIKNYLPIGKKIVFAP
jgi:hypothetical protein